MRTAIKQVSGLAYLAQHCSSTRKKVLALYSSVWCGSLNRSTWDEVDELLGRLNLCYYVWTSVCGHWFSFLYSMCCQGEKMVDPMVTVSKLLKTFRKCSKGQFFPWAECQASPHIQTDTCIVWFWFWPCVRDVEELLWLWHVLMSPSLWVLGGNWLRSRRSFPLVALRYSRSTPGLLHTKHVL